MLNMTDKLWIIINPASWLHALWIHGSSNPTSWIHGYMDTWIHGYIHHQNLYHGHIHHGYTHHWYMHHGYMHHINMHHDNQGGLGCFGLLESLSENLQHIGSFGEAHFRLLHLLPHLSLQNVWFIWTLGSIQIGPLVCIYGRNYINCREGRNKYWWWFLYLKLQ